jgi:signal transduction histidine kinase
VESSGLLIQRVAQVLWDTDSIGRRVIYLAGLGAIVYSIAAGASALPGQQRLGVLSLTAVASVAFLVGLLIKGGRPAVVALGVLGIAGGALAGLAPGAGSAFAFVAVFSAGHRLPARIAAAVALVTMAVLTIAGFAGDQLSGRTVLGLSVGLVAAALGGLNRAAQQRAREQAELLVAEGQVVIEERARSAALAERTRIAREIHDVLAHSLSGLTLQLEAAHLLLEQRADPARVAEHVDRARGLARSGLEETKRALQTLRGEPLPTAELLAELVEAHRSSTGPVELVVTGIPRPLPADVGLTLYRVTQEALTNTGRHAAGAQAEVYLGYQDRSVQLTVTDHRAADDHPVDERPSTPPGGGYGLVGMRERAELLGGELSVGPTPDGWRVGLRVPI